MICLEVAIYLLLVVKWCWIGFTLNDYVVVDELMTLTFVSFCGCVCIGDDIKYKSHTFDDICLQIWGWISDISEIFSLVHQTRVKHCDWCFHELSLSLLKKLLSQIAAFKLTHVLEICECERIHLTTPFVDVKK